MILQEYNRRRTLNGFELSGEFLVSVRPEGGWHLTPKPGAEVKVYEKGKSPARLKGFSPKVMWLDEVQNFHWEERPPVPALTKEQGMNLAYNPENEEMLHFEALLYEFCCSIGSDVLFSSDDIWNEWRGRGWPDPKKRSFAGPVMDRAVKAGWTERVERVKNEMQWAHSTEKNWAYRSLITLDNAQTTS